MSDAMDLSAKVVLITSSSSGIGAMTAIEFSRAGAQVVITGRNSQNLSEVSEVCSRVSPKGLQPLEVVADVDNEEDCKRLIDCTIKAFKKLDILVNNVGVGAIGAIGYVNDSNILETLEQMIETNMRSVKHLIHYSNEYLEKTNGIVINVSILSEPISDTHSMPLFCVSRYVIDMFDNNSSLDPSLKFENNLNSNEGQYESLLSMKAQSYLFGKVGESIDISDAIIFLASDESSFVTGINIVSDTGSLLAISETEVSNYV